jgi:hypothetical protein
VKKYVMDTDNNEIVSMELEEVERSGVKIWVDEYGIHIFRNLVFDNFESAKNHLIESMREEADDYIQRAQKLYRDINRVILLREENV